MPLCPVIGWSIFVQMSSWRTMVLASLSLISSASAAAPTPGWQSAATAQVAGTRLRAGPEQELAQPGPSVYWVSNPNLVNETVVVAGAFPGLETTLALCTTPGCDAGSTIHADWTPSPWPHSVKLVLPPNCGPPCFLHLGSSGTARSTDIQQQGAETPKTTTVAINAPDVWWALGGSPSHISAASALQSRETLSNKPLRVFVRVGDAIRVFGRSLAWNADNSECLSAAKDPQSVATTRLYLAVDEEGRPKGHAVASASATCYEATFRTTDATGYTFPLGDYPAAVVVTQWGTSKRIHLTVEAAQSPKDHVISVGPQQPGALVAAIAEAKRYQAESPKVQVNISMEAGLYKLKEPITLPNRTNLIGAGAGTTVLEFDLHPPPPPPNAPPPQCSKPYVLEDFYTKDCADRGCRTRECPGCFLEITAIHTAYSADGCCAACGKNPQCNAWTFVGSVDLPGGYCSLNYCPDEPGAGHKSSCASTPSSPTPNNRTSGWVLNRTNTTIPTRAAAAIVITGHSNCIQDFSLRMATALPQTPAVWAQPNSTQFTATGLNVTLLQHNVSNAFKIEAVGFEVTSNTMNQVGSCLYPNYGPKSDSTPFQPSVTIYMHNARTGLLANNTVYWRCSAFDLDVSDRVIFEENEFICTETGVVPHGNSISGYDWHLNPSSRWWSVSRNRLSRPPYKHGAEQNWIQRETITTDGSGSWGVAHVEKMDGAQLQLKWLTLTTPPKVGTTLLVLDGPGVGQSRQIVSVGAGNATIVLDTPLDDWVVTASALGSSAEQSADAIPSKVAVVSSFGSKIFAGNTFNWTEVVQWYGNTIRGVMADNNYHDCNVQPGGNINHGAMGAVGECYHGSDPVWYSEFRQNSMVRSDGISLRDSYMAPSGEGGACAAYGGPWIRWSVIRANSMSGISQASLNESAKTEQPPVCAAVSIFSSGYQYPPKGGSEATSDVVAEQNEFECPSTGLQNSSGYHLNNCHACVARL